jgi:hypothetical protein
VRLTISTEAERGFLKRWRIGKLLRRPEQIGWRRWTIGKMFRRSGHCSLRIPRITLDEQ